MVWQGDFSCFVGSYPWCDWWVVSPWWQSTYLLTIAKAIGIPALVFGGGLAILWISAGFKTNRPSN